MQQAVAEAREEILDLSEDVLTSALKGETDGKGDRLTAARFVLETIGRGRGYSRRTIMIHHVDPRKLTEDELNWGIAELQAEVGDTKH